MNWVDFKNINKDLFRSKEFLHFSFWVLLYFFLVLVDKWPYPVWFKMIRHLIDVSFWVTIVYVNILYLIPKYLQVKKPILYLLSLLFVIVLISPIHITSMILLFKNNTEDARYFADNQSTIFMLNLFVGLASTLYKILTDWLIHQNEKIALETQNLQSELKFLKSQINPHFFFNTLNNLYALTLKKSDSAPEIVLRLSEMMRYMLYESNEKQVSLEKEINYVKNYLELEKLRQGHKFDINFNLNGEIKDQKIAPLMFIPFLENSFKHGLDNQIKSGFVNIDLNLNESSVDLAIENSKPPSIPQKMPEKKSGGIGLKNVKRRLKLLYPQRHRLDIEEKPHSFKVFLNIQLT
ncbi:MAG: histidine kinase [Saprospiraceae bacterium]|nr:histidine kinase [Bacteroidia bacterium]NNE14475.1 histidine kinase [Saprospiraceae bacterium]NNL92752.1 histidine kinase [Saprospiraceae bacterium]